MQIDPAPPAQARPQVAIKASDNPVPPVRPAPACPADLLENSRALRREMRQLARLPDLTRLGPPAPIPGDLPDRVDDLGVPIASLQIPGVKAIGDLVAAVIVLAPALGMFFISVAAFVGGEGRGAGPWLIGMTGALLVGLAIWIIRRRRVVLPMHLWVCPEGVIWEHGDRVGYCRWDQVESVSAPSSDVEQPLWFTPREGVEFVLSPRLGPAATAIARYVELRTAAALLPNDLAAVLKGKRVHFGELALDSDGVICERRHIPWREVSEIITAGDQLIIHHTRGRRPISVALRLVSFPRVAEGIARVMIEEELPG